MALFKPCRVTRANLLDLPKKAGQIIYVLDTGEICMDIAINASKPRPVPKSVNKEEKEVAKFSLPTNGVAVLSDEKYDNSIYRFFINRGHSNGNAIKADAAGIDKINLITDDIYIDYQGDFYVADENLIYYYNNVNKGDLIEGQTNLYSVTFEATACIYQNEDYSTNVLDGYSNSYVNIKEKRYSLSGVLNDTTKSITDIKIIDEYIWDSYMFIGYSANYCLSVYDEEQYGTLFLNIDNKVDNTAFDDTMGAINSVLERLDTGEGV